MPDRTREKLIADFVLRSVRAAGQVKKSPSYAKTLKRLERAFLLLPPGAADLFLSGSRELIVMIRPDPGFPLGMATRSEGAADARRYSIVVYEEHLSWPEDLFIASFLRELGHVVAERPPEEEWPQARAERARHKAVLECRADAMVWKWGLRHYSMRHLTHTYPKHWVDEIVADIEKMLREE